MRENTKRATELAKGADEVAGYRRGGFGEVRIRAGLGMTCRIRILSPNHKRVTVPTPPR